MLGSKEQAGIVICTRLSSHRIPNKAAVNINGKSILNHLYSRIKKTNLPVVFAYPIKESSEYLNIVSKFEDRGFSLFDGNAENPMLRMYRAAIANKLDIVIRVTHDKIFVDHEQILKALEIFKTDNLEYLSCYGLTPGTGFEIMSLSSLARACDKFNTAEHLTYAIRAVTHTGNHVDILPGHIGAIETKDVRLLIDYPKDIELMTAIFAILGNDCTLKEVLSLVRSYQRIRQINKMPKVTIYTCSYNSREWIYECLHSILTQTMIDECELLIIDDHSTDNSPIQMALTAAANLNVRYIRNNKNLGLSSSSNVALREARGDYIIRLDSDDFFTSKHSIKQIYSHILQSGKDIIYPDNRFGSTRITQKGYTKHHVGGTMFKTSAIKHLQFTDNLRNHDSLDIWARSKDVLKIGYLNRAIFFYRQHDSSMSKTNLVERKQTEDAIKEAHL